MKTGKETPANREGNDAIGREAILKVTKEITVKFIEMGRVTPATFDETFKNIHTTISETVHKG